MPEPSTSRGRQVKARIVSVAAELMYEKGIRATTVDDILAASGTGKSQFYHYFRDKDTLIVDVLSHQLQRILEDQDRFALDSWDGFMAWFQTLIEMYQSRWALHGCPLGSLAAEAQEHGERLRGSAAEAFARWESSLAAALQIMRDNGELDSGVDPTALAEVLIAILQGGYLLSSIKRDIRPMSGAVDAAVRYLRSNLVQNHGQVIDEGSR